jgi:adenosylmethionine-8-amino-7-oxononanoate aminotransferase
VGKGLGRGYLPIAAVLVSKKVVDVLAAGSGTFINGFTYQSHPTCCAAALAVQSIIKNDSLLLLAAELGKELQDQMTKIIVPLPQVGNVRGAGLFWGVEFVKDKRTKVPFPKTGFAKNVVDNALQRGVQVYVCEGIADGLLGDAIILAPSYTSRKEDIVTIVDVLRCAISSSCT